MAGYMFNDLMWCRQEEDSGRSLLVLRNKELKKLKHNASHITYNNPQLYCFVIYISSRQQFSVKHFTSCLEAPGS